MNQNQNESSAKEPLDIEDVDGNNLRNGLQEKTILNEEESVWQETVVPETAVGIEETQMLSNKEGCNAETYEIEMDPLLMVNRSVEEERYRNLEDMMEYEIRQDEDIDATKSASPLNQEREADLKRRNQTQLFIPKQV